MYYLATAPRGALPRAPRRGARAWLRPAVHPDGAPRVSTRGRLPTISTRTLFNEPWGRAVEDALARRSSPARPTGRIVLLRIAGGFLMHKDDYRACGRRAERRRCRADAESENCLASSTNQNQDKRSRVTGCVAAGPTTPTDGRAARHDGDDAAEADKVAKTHHPTRWSAARLMELKPDQQRGTESAPQAQVQAVNNLQARRAATGVPRPARRPAALKPKVEDDRAGAHCHASAGDPVSSVRRWSRI